MRTRDTALLLLLVVAPVALPAAGCGSPWSSVAVSSFDESNQSLGEYARFTLKDDRVVEMRVTDVKYPFVWGNRVLGRWSTSRQLRVDLREVSKVEVRNTAS